MSQTLLDSLAATLSQAGQYNRNDQIAPAAILWTDEARQWESLVPVLRQRIPLLTFGAYTPETRTGPAYWLRCMIGGSLDSDQLPIDSIPIVYLPGYGKNDLRAIEECPRELQPIAELQYRGTLWVHANGRDWTVSGYLHNLDIPVAGDAATKLALVRALPQLGEQPLDYLRQHAPLRSQFLNQLMHPDPSRQVLLWMSNPQAYREGFSSAEWQAFVALCKSTFGFNLDSDGPVVAARRLAQQEGRWPEVWDRYLEAPRAYPSIPKLLEESKPPEQLSLFRQSAPYWPQDTRGDEMKLRSELLALGSKTAVEARARVLTLESAHGPRREWVWARLGYAPLALAMAGLAELAEYTAQALGGTSVEKIASAYVEWGWKVDAAVVTALASVTQPEDAAAVKAAILPLYRPWLENAANQLQQAVRRNAQALRAPQIMTETGTCILFSDALRYDLAQQLVAKLRQNDVSCDLGWQFAALPTVTPTAKPAVSPVADQLNGEVPGLSPTIDGSIVNASQLRDTLSRAGHQILNSDEVGDAKGRAWTELGAIDQYGHQHGWKLAHHIESEIAALEARVLALLDAGWRQIVVVTDHGWLLLPNGMPTSQLSVHLALQRKGRCAVLKPGATTDLMTTEWHWNSAVSIAYAPAITCFEAGKEYEHGGISPQECIVPILRIKPE